MKMKRKLWITGLFAALALAPACQEPLAERCYLSTDCADGLVCSNGDMRVTQGFCVTPPEEEPVEEEPTTEEPDAGADESDADTTQDEDGGSDAG